MSTFSIFIVTAFTAIVAFTAGIYYERLQWSKLIKEGKLPKPKERN